MSRLVLLVNIGVKTVVEQIDGAIILTHLAVDPPVPLKQSVTQNGTVSSSSIVCDKISFNLTRSVTDLVLDIRSFSFPMDLGHTVPFV